MCGGTPAYSATQRVRTLRPRRARRPPGRHRASRAAGSASAAAPVLSGLTAGVPLQFTLTRLTVFLKGVLFLLASSAFEAHGALRNENVTSVYQHRVRRSHPYPGTSAALGGLLREHLQQVAMDIASRHRRCARRPEGPIFPGRLPGA